MNPKRSWLFCSVTRNHLKIHKTKRLVVNLSCVIKPVKPITIWEENVEQVYFHKLHRRADMFEKKVGAKLCERVRKSHIWSSIGSFCLLRKYSISFCSNRQWCCTRKPSLIHRLNSNSRCETWVHSHCHCTFLFDCTFMLMCSCVFEHFGLEFVTQFIKIHILTLFLKLFSQPWNVINMHKILICHGKVIKIKKKILICHRN